MKKLSFSIDLSFSIFYKVIKCIFDQVLFDVLTLSHNIALTLKTELFIGNCFLLNYSIILSAATSLEKANKK